MNKHSPAPWRIDPLGGVCVRDAGSDMLALLSEWAPAFHDERDANARLMAAAPELLEALKEACSFRAALCGNSDDSDQPIDPRRWDKPLMRWSAVLAKATGEGE